MKYRSTCCHTRVQEVVLKMIEIMTEMIEIKETEITHCLRNI